jgi:DNA repair exonuclease SbcCD ATPase subunit
LLLLPAQVSARDKEWEEAKHKEELAALTERFQRRIEQLQAERTEGQSLEAIMQTVSSSADEVRGLTAALQQERLTSLEEKEAAYRARAALLQDKEARLMALASQLEKDRTSGLSLQMSIEQMSQHAAESLEQDRARLAQEHVRLERMQRSLETERMLVKDTLACELKRMEEETSVRTQEHQAFTTEIARERKALTEQRSALLQQEADLRRRQEAGTRDLDALRQRLEHDRQQQAADKEALTNHQAAIRAEADALALERTPPSSCPPFPFEHKGPALWG